MEVDKFEMSVETVALRETITYVCKWMAISFLISMSFSYFVSNSSYMIEFLYENIDLLSTILILQIVSSGFVANLILHNGYKYWILLAIFLIQSILSGFTLQMIIIYYAEVDITHVFLSLSLIFGLFYLLGIVTKVPLNKWYSYISLILFGYILGSTINILFAYTALSWLFTYVSVLVFAIHLRSNILSLSKILEKKYTNLSNSEKLKFPILIYLDFFNVFLLLIRIFDREQINYYSNERD